MALRRFNLQLFMVRKAHSQLTLLKQNPRLFPVQLCSGLVHLHPRLVTAGFARGVMCMVFLQNKTPPSITFNSQPARHQLSALTTAPPL